MPVKTTRKKPPSSNPETIRVLPLRTPSEDDEIKRGRRRKRKLPSLPQEILDGMSELEQEFYVFFVEETKAENPDLTGTDQMLLMFAGIEMINMLRLDQKQLASGELISMARQHPGVQFRSLVDMLSVSRKARKSGRASNNEPAEDPLTQKLMGMSKW